MFGRHTQTPIEPQLPVLDLLPEYHVHRLFYPVVQLRQDLMSVASLPVMPQMNILHVCFGDVAGFEQWCDALVHGFKGRVSALLMERMSLGLLISSLFYLAWRRNRIVQFDNSSLKYGDCALPPFGLLMKEEDMIPSKSHLQDMMIVFRDFLKGVIQNDFEEEKRWIVNIMPNDKKLGTLCRQLTQILANCQFSFYVPEVLNPETGSVGPCVRKCADLQYIVCPNNGGAGVTVWSHPLIRNAPLWQLPSALHGKGVRQGCLDLMLRWTGIVNHSKVRRADQMQDVQWLMQLSHHKVVQLPFLQQWGVLHLDALLYWMPFDVDLWRILKGGPTEQDVERSLFMQRLVSVRGGSLSHLVASDTLCLVRRPKQWLDAAIKRSSANVLSFCGIRNANTIDKHKRFAVNRMGSPRPSPEPLAAHTVSDDSGTPPDAMQAICVQEFNATARRRVQTDFSGPSDEFERLMAYMNAKIFYGGPSFLSVEFLKKLRAGSKWVFLRWGDFIVTGNQLFSEPLHVDELKAWWEEQTYAVLHHMANHPLKVWHVCSTLEDYTTPSNQYNRQQAQQLTAIALQASYRQLCIVNAAHAPQVLQWAVSTIYGSSASAAGPSTLPSAVDCASPTSPARKRKTPDSPVSFSDED
jgi:hypothetical protein